MMSNLERAVGVPWEDLAEVIRRNIIGGVPQVVAEERVQPARAAASSTPERKKMSDRVTALLTKDGGDLIVTFNGHLVMGCKAITIETSGRVAISKYDGQRLVAKAGELVAESGPGQLPAQDDEPAVNLSKAAADVASFFDRYDGD
jgi:hypothetical protein